MPVDVPPPQTSAVVVTAARLPPPPGDQVFSIVILTPETLRTRERLDEALEQTPGLSLFRRTTSLAANPTTQGISLRAFAPSGAGRTLVTLDGVPQNDPFGGWVIWTALPAESLEGAEIVHGAGAGAYGAGALTGTVALSERGGAPGGAADISGGELGFGRVAGAIDERAGPLDLLLVASAEHADGWIPVIAGRGPADDQLSLNDWSLAARGQAMVGGGVLAMRGGAYQEIRQAGLVGAHARARGDFASLTWAAAPAPGGYGWRLQAWMRQSDLLNTSVSVAANQASTTPANDQYSTPAIGYGFNGAVRRAWTSADLEVGVDVRATSGDEHELFSYSVPLRAFTRDRDAGGRTLVAGAYLEADRTLGAWLIAGGVRADYWGSSGAHRIERSTATGAITLNQPSPDRSGVLPTARIGVKRPVGDGFYVRAAAYAGFRPATLNELYRPFRVGNNTTNANPLLRPERLEGVEIGVGGEGRGGDWSLTAFGNRLDDAIANVTIGPQAGGILSQRQNAGRIDAAGLEGQAEQRLGDVTLSFAGDWTWSRVDGGTQAPQLTGLRPAQAPRLTLTAAADWRPIAQLTLRAQARYESARFDDDLNTHVLAAATTVNLEARYRLTPMAEIYLAADNVFDVRVQTAQAADGTFSYDAPTLVRVGLSLRG
ncbi:MAG: TonB-dependent receptor [Caulobacterales bacterium]